MPRFFGQADGIRFKQAVCLELCGVAYNTIFNTLKSRLKPFWLSRLLLFQYEFLYGFSHAVIIVGLTDIPGDFFDFLLAVAHHHA